MRERGMAQLGRRVKQSVLWTFCSQSPRVPLWHESGSTLGATTSNSLRVSTKIKSKNIRGMAQLVARLSGGQEAVSSSLATPTNIKKTVYYRFFLLRCWWIDLNEFEFTYERSEYYGATHLVA